ncbi:MAG: hypothetical protein IJT44_12450 [Clostridia bacterium]|nr:hypothetical protein [Clostridia bacterium]
MTADYTGVSICAAGPVALQAAKMLQEELRLRTGVLPTLVDMPKPPCIRLICDAEISDKDIFRINTSDRCVTVAGQGIRALIYGYSRFLRKAELDGEKINLTEPIDGEYRPAHSIRGHQLGCRDCSNTYDAWTVGQYTRYFLDLMAFGCNMIELIPSLGKGGKNALMPLDPDDLCVQVCAEADKLDLDVSLWIPNDTYSVEESAEIRRRFFEKCPRLNVVFPPGGDPGDLPAEEFMTRVKAISRALKQTKPDAEMWPSAQAPHSVQDWGDAFIREMQARPTEVAGVITGPNRAFPLDVLRRKLPAEYPIRLYPDITHNVRCEYPVHALHDDWHFALASTLSRECINPRPQEYRLIHRLTRGYVVGSVSYSEGVNDDVNKMVWSDMDYDPDCSLTDTLLDYARFFIPQAPAEKIADGILALEKNWIGDPAENPHIESTFALFDALAREKPVLPDNWRFCQLLFRAACDAYVRRRRVFDLRLVRTAREAIGADEPGRAREALLTPYPQDVTDLRALLDELAGRLFRLIGQQLDCARFGANHWERGATLETIDLPVTDREYYLNRLEYADSLPPERRKPFFAGLLNRCATPEGGYYFSVALHGLEALGERQTPDYYMDFQGDRPDVNNGSIPISQLKLFDHFSFRCKLGGFTAGDYKLRVSYSSRKTPDVSAHSVTVNGRVIYCGGQYGGEKDARFDLDYLAPGTESATYILPASCFENGCADLVIEEPTVGVMLSEFWIFPA